MRGLPAFRTSGFVVYTKVALWSSKSEHGTPTGGGTLDYMLSIDRLLSGFVSLIRVCHPSARQMKQSAFNCMNVAAVFAPKKMYG